MGSTRFVPIVKGRSGVARLGLFIHATADLIDIGSINQWTLQLIPTLDVKVYPGMRIGQVTFWEVAGPIEHYSGKYQDSKGPVASMIHLDMPRSDNYNPD
jgi:dCTP deaminase